jgi:hypothetical protein
MAHTIYKNKSGKRLKSVTTLINAHLGWSKGALIGWTRKHCLKGEDSMGIMKEAGRIGTLAHKMIEEFIKGGSVLLDDYTPNEISQAKTAYYGYYKWQQDNHVKFIETEMKLVSEKYGFGGTFDAVAIVNGKLVICDWKTSNAVHDEFLVQLAAYRQLWNEHIDKKYTVENTPVAKSIPGVLVSRKKMWKIKGAILLKLDKEEKGVYEEHHYKIKDLNWGWRIFKLILKLQELKK